MVTQLKDKGRVLREDSRSEYRLVDDNRGKIYGL